MKTIVFLANLLFVCSAQDLKAEGSVIRTILKPSGKPLISVEESRPQIEYITSANQDEVRPAFEYISTPNVEQRPTIEYISKRPAAVDYINSYPSLDSTYNSYAYSHVPRYSYSLPQRGYQTAYQYIRPVVQQRVERGPMRSYPLTQSYYPLRNAYHYQDQYQYQYYPRYLSQYVQPLSTYSLGPYLPIIPLKKKK